MHLLPEFGNTIKEIKNDGFNIAAKFKIFFGVTNEVTLAKSVGIGILKFVDVFRQLKPDFLLVLGDRQEPFSATVAAAHMNIPIAHIHGGEKATGYHIDEPIRHSITKFAHIHFPSTEKGAKRILRMGEEKWRIHVVGPLGIYSLPKGCIIDKETLVESFSFNPEKPILLVVQHPVSIFANKAADEMEETMEALTNLGEQTVLIYPNADPGSKAMINVIERYKKYKFIRVYKNLPYILYVSLMANANVMIGNSSSAFVEAPLFGLPAVNIGIRQDGREQAGNIINVPYDRDSIARVVEGLLKDKKLRKKIKRRKNPYLKYKNGAEEIANVLSKIKINHKLLEKKITY